MRAAAPPFDQRVYHLTWLLLACAFVALCHGLAEGVGGGGGQGADVTEDERRQVEELRADKVRLERDLACVRADREVAVGRLNRTHEDLVTVQNQVARLERALAEARAKEARESGDLKQP